MALPVKQGHLTKYRNPLKGWELRYFKLKRSYLLYYEAEHAPDPKKSVVRTEILSASPYPGISDKQYCFQLNIKPHEKWLLVASSELPQAEATPSSEPQGKTAKEKELEALEGDGRHSPTLPVPPIPSYMVQEAAATAAAAAASPSPSAPPGDSDVFSHPPPSYLECTQFRPYKPPT